MGSIGAFIRLTEVVPPPDWPVRGNGDWKRFWSVNGFTPPEDYRMLIREYGAGTFGNWVRLIEPFNHSWSFIEKVETECRRLRARPSPGWSLWPEPGGFLLWAITATGDHIGWRTLGRPDAWTTLFWGRNGNSGEYEMTAVEFLLGLFERTLGDPVRSRGDASFEPVPE